VVLAAAAALNAVLVKLGLMVPLPWIHRDPSHPPTTPQTTGKRIYSSAVIAHTRTAPSATSRGCKFSPLFLMVGQVSCMRRLAVRVEPVACGAFLVDPLANFRRLTRLLI
jgi:hypothetical protein